MRTTTIALGLAAVIVLAGCVTGPGGSPTASPTDSTAASTSHPTTAAAASTTTPPASPPETESPGSDETEETADSTDDADGAAVADAAVRSLTQTRGVVVEGTLTRRVETPSGTSEATIEFAERVDAVDRELGVERTLSANGRTVETATYLVNDTLYERSPAYEREYGTEWVRLPADGAWRNASSTAVVARLVNASTATLVENTTVDGERAVVLALDVDTDELAALSGIPIDDESINALSGTITVDADTGRLYAASVHVNRTVENQYGQEVTVVTDVDRTFTTTGLVEISLPDGADDATPINATQG